MRDKSFLSVDRNHDPGLHNRLKVLIYTRLVFISILLAATIFIVLSDEEALYGISVVFIFILIAATILASFIFALTLFFIGGGSPGKLKALSYSQIFWDILFATAVLYLTGGVESIFYLLYYVNIVIASVLLFKKGGLLAASLSAICYGGVLALEVRGVLPQFYNMGFEIDTVSETHVLAKIIINWLFFFFLALVASFVTEKLREAEVLLEEKQIDIENLEEFNFAIVQSLKSGLLTLDSEDRILSFNESASRILRMPPEKLKGQKLNTIFPGVSGEITEEVSSKGRNNLWRWETTIEVESDQKLYLGLNAFPFRMKEILEGGKIVIFEDLTSFKRMENRVKRTEKLAAIGELAAGIAHEIRNPLASMSGAIEMLKQEDADKRGKERLMDIVLRETTRLDYLISDFLNFAKTPKLSKEVFSVNSLLDDAVELFLKNRKEGNGFDIQRKFGHNVYISADPAQIKQVIWNLLKNSAESMRDKGKIEVVTEIDDESGEFVIKVKDEGEGIMQEDLNRIFSPFFTTKKGGTGLGLATVHKIIEEHGGRISVDSKIGLGSEFRVYLPMD